MSTSGQDWRNKKLVNLPTHTGLCGNSSFWSKNGQKVERSLSHWIRHMSDQLTKKLCDGASAPNQMGWLYGSIWASHLPLPIVPGNLQRRVRAESKWVRKLKGLKRYQRPDPESPSYCRWHYFPIVLQKLFSLNRHWVDADLSSQWTCTCRRP